MTNARAGFTLLEILVAMTVFAVAATGLFGAMGQGLRQQRSLELKTFASWVAENRLAEMRTARSWPNTGQEDEDVEMAENQWHVKSVVSETSNADLRKIQMTVALSLPPGSSEIYALTGFIGRY